MGHARRDAITTGRASPRAARATLQSPPGLAGGGPAPGGLNVGRVLRVSVAAPLCRSRDASAPIHQTRVVGVEPAPAGLIACRISVLCVSVASRRASLPGGALRCTGRLDRSKASRWRDAPAPACLRRRHKRVQRLVRRDRNEESTSPFRSSDAITPVCHCRLASRTTRQSVPAVAGREPAPDGLSACRVRRDAIAASRACPRAARETRPPRQPQQAWSLHQPAQVSAVSGASRSTGRVPFARCDCPRLSL